jgi:hypothetical protein
MRSKQLAKPSISLKGQEEDREEETVRRLTFRPERDGSSNKVSEA